jgi:hypothetical protein
MHVFQHIYLIVYWLTARYCSFPVGYPSRVVRLSTYKTSIFFKTRKCFAWDVWKTIYRILQTATVLKVGHIVLARTAHPYFLILLLTRTGVINHFNVADRTKPSIAAEEQLARRIHRNKKGKWMKLHLVKNNLSSDKLQHLTVPNHCISSKLSTHDHIHMINYLNCSFLFLFQLVHLAVPNHLYFFIIKFGRPHTYDPLTSLAISFYPFWKLCLSCYPSVLIRQKRILHSFV